MPAEIELKLEDLAKIALGSPELSNVHIAVLHSLLEILLKKLNCQDEKVSLSAYECKSLKKMLDKAYISPLAFNDENVELISKKLERVENLEEQISKLDTKLTCHLNELEDIKKTDNEIKIDWQKWNDFGCEDLCTTCDPENDLACKLLKNTDFLRKLLRRISSPMVERIFILEEKVGRLHEEFTKFLEFIKEEYIKIELLQTCIEEIEFLRIKINENHAQFLCTMEEVQDMLDAKLDKLHMPALKKYIRDRFNRIEETMMTIQSQKECPRAAGIIKDGLQCLSCGSNKVCSEVDVQPAVLLPDVKPGIIKGPQNNNNDKHVGCNVANETATSAQFKRLTADLPKLQKKVMESPRNQCQNYLTDIEFLEGSDGKLYRKG